MKQGTKVKLVNPQSGVEYTGETVSSVALFQVRVRWTDNGAITTERVLDLQEL